MMMISLICGSVLLGASVYNYSKKYYGLSSITLGLGVFNITATVLQAL
jgi:hypothetical protein